MKHLSSPSDNVFNSLPRRMRTTPQFEVGEAIIVSDSILMMNLFVSLKRSFQMLLHDIAMFSHPPGGLGTRGIKGDDDIDVSVSRDVSLFRDPSLIGASTLQALVMSGTEILGINEMVVATFGLTRVGLGLSPVLTHIASLAELASASYSAGTLDGVAFLHKDYIADVSDYGVELGSDPKMGTA